MKKYYILISTYACVKSYSIKMQAKSLMHVVLFYIAQPYLLILYYFVRTQLLK